MYLLVRDNFKRIDRKTRWYLAKDVHDSNRRRNEDVSVTQNNINCTTRTAMRKYIGNKKAFLFLCFYFVQGMIDIRHDYTVKPKVGYTV